MSKYEGMVFEGRWKVVKAENIWFTLENIYNHETMQIRRNTFILVVRGQTTISNIRSARVYRTDKTKVPKVVKRQRYMKKRRLENEHKTMENL